jgi:hypothetical protein
VNRLEEVTQHGQTGTNTRTLSYWTT